MIITSSELSRISFSKMMRSLLRPANTVITRLPAAFKACTIGSIGATPTPPPAQITVPNFSIWVACPSGLYYVSDRFAFIQLAETGRRKPDFLHYQSNGTLFRSEPAIVNGIRSPFSPTRTMTKCPYFTRFSN